MGSSSVITTLCSQEIYQLTLTLDQKSSTNIKFMYMCILVPNWLFSLGFLRSPQILGIQFKNHDIGYGNYPIHLSFVTHWRLANMRVQIGLDFIGLASMNNCTGKINWYTTGQVLRFRHSQNMLQAFPLHQSAMKQINKWITIRCDSVLTIYVWITTPYHNVFSTYKQTTTPYHNVVTNYNWTITPYNSVVTIYN